MSRPPATTRWPIEDILARTDLAALLDEFAQPDQRARRWHCPLNDHDDNHASVTMHRDQRGHERWRCWSGDQRHRGDAVDLIQAVRGSTRSEAIDELAARAGLQPGRELPPIAQRTPTAPPAVALDERVVAYANICARLLWSPLGTPVREWLHNRGLGDDVLRANQVGADPGRDRLRRSRGIPSHANQPGGLDWAIERTRDLTGDGELSLHLSRLRADLTRLAPHPEPPGRQGLSVEL